MARIEITITIDGKLFAAWNTNQPDSQQLHERLSEAVKRELDRYSFNDITVEAFTTKS